MIRVIQRIKRRMVEKMGIKRITSQKRKLKNWSYPGDQEKGGVKFQEVYCTPTFPYWGWR